MDDTPANLHLLTNLLKQNGYLVRPFPSGKLGLTGIEHAVPALILLDIQMTNMNGYEVCQHLKANEKTCDIPVIFISVELHGGEVSLNSELGVGKLFCGRLTLVREGRSNKVYLKKWKFTNQFQLSSRKYRSCD
ncbi:response regulator [Calothrix sp. 336/3]|uniref:response regulator n=1 Tax=Calothrix sp. 336/3 TaxID=1337936 RepID=UPI002112FDB6|nr:response regulator [Calothrix sp. 336/3]